MNKLFTKIAGLTLGLSLAVGGGAFLAKSASKDVKASEAAAYTLDGTVTASGTNYAGDNEVTQGGIKWIVNGNVSQNPWRIGGNKNNGLSTAGTVRAVKSSAAVSAEDITKVVVTSVKPSSNGITPTDVSLKVGTAAGGSQTSSLSNGSWAASVTFNRPSGKSWANQYFEIDFTMPANTTTTSKYITLTSIVFYYESAVQRGEFSLDPLDSNVLFVGDSGKMNYTWNPLDSGASVASTQFISSDEDVLTIDNSGNYEAKAAGSVKVTFNATDTNSEAYSVQSSTIFVSNNYDFEVGDKVALHAPSILKELSGIDSGNYGTGADYSTNPNGTFTLDVESGSVGGSLAFSNDGAYLSWASGNTLKTASSIDDNSSWYVIAYDDRYSINNVADNAREIWWNNGSPRFACYTGKTPSTSGYNTVSLYKIDEVPVRGTIAITAPSETLMRQGANGSLTYSWTPADDSSATISSYAWSSNDSAVISVSGDTYTAVAPGKTKISLHAVDSTGQEYDVNSSDITVVEVVSGSYVKYTSLSVGDTVTIVCEADTTQLAGIVKISSNDVGDYAYYDPSPASLYDLTVEEGSSVGSFAFATSESKYLTWSSGNTLTLSEDITDNSSWTVSFDEGNANINNIADSTRVIRWNHSSPRFATYAGGQTAVQLYGPDTDIVLSENALNFVNGLLGLTCDESGQTAPSTETWGDLNTAYTATGPEEILAAEKLLIQGFDAVEHLSPVTNREKLEQAMAKYDYVVGKYNKGQGLTTEYPDFIERDPAALRNVTPTVASESSNSAITIVVVIAITSVTSIGVLLVLKRRKSY